MLQESTWSCYKKFALIFSVTVFMSTALFIASSQTKEDLLTRVRRSGKTHHKSATSNTTRCADLLNCDDCASFRNFKCMWCNSGNGKCMDYPIDNLYPHTSDCKWSDAKWGVCWLDFQAIMIIVAVIGGILLLILVCFIVKICRCCADCWHCICCCWSCCDDKGALSNKERKSLRNMERSLRMQQKRQELQMKYNTTNRPSGVPYGTTGNYEQFTNEDV